MTFTVPVNPDGNHNGYTITVTLNVIRESKINVTVKTSRTWLGFVPVYHAAISASSDDTQILRVEHSLTGYYYTVGSQLTSLLPLSRFYIRVMDSNRIYHYYVYQNGQVIER